MSGHNIPRPESQTEYREKEGGVKGDDSSLWGSKMCLVVKYRLIEMG